MLREVNQEWDRHRWDIKEAGRGKADTQNKKYGFQREAPLLQGTLRAVEDGWQILGQ